MKSWLGLSNYILTLSKIVYRVSIGQDSCTLIYKPNFIHYLHYLTKHLFIQKTCNTENFAPFLSFLDSNKGILAPNFSVLSTFLKKL